MSLLRAALWQVLDKADDVVYLLTRGFLMTLETVRRGVLRLDPRLYAQNRRIRAVTEGLALKPSDKFAVFVVYSRSALPDFTTTFIKALNRHSYNVIIVSNAALGATTKSALLDQCCLLVERINFGRDFGGYKDGIDIAFRRFSGMQRLIIGNDSLYYLESGLDDLIAGLDGPQDFIGVSEVFEHHYHVASFLLSFGPRVLADPVFRRFWADYRPIPTRMWAILEGEGELTRHLVEAGHRPHVLFRAQSLLPKLLALSASERRQALALFPARIRKAVAPLMEAPTAPADGPAFADAVVDEIMKRNQMHAAGFAFMKFLGLPLFKRDIVYRELFPLEEASRIMTEFVGPMREEIVADLARRTPPGRFDLLRRLLYQQGYI